MVSGVSNNKSTGNVSGQKSNNNSPARKETKNEVKGNAQGTAGIKDVAPSNSGLKEGRLDALTDAQDAARTNKAFQPRDGKTYCNLGVAQTLKDIGIDVTDEKVGISNPKNGQAYLANKIADNLSESAKKEDGYWQKIDAKKAQELANEGFPVVGAFKGSPHGHVVTVRPEGYDKGLSSENGGVIVNNIGSNNVVQNDTRPFSYYAQRNTQGY